MVEIPEVCYVYQVVRTGSGVILGLLVIVVHIEGRLERILSLRHWIYYLHYLFSLTIEFRVLFKSI